MSAQDALLALRASGLTQTEIAKRTGIPQPRLSRWEGGAVPPSADDGLKLVRLLVRMKRRKTKCKTSTPEKT